MTAKLSSVALRKRRDSVLLELRMVERKMAALNAFVGFCNERTFAHERIDALLNENADIAFTPAEIGEACQLGEHALRAALKRMSREGRIRHIKHALYQALGKVTANPRY